MKHSNEMTIIDGHLRMFFARTHNLTEIPVLLYPGQTPKEVVLHLFLSGIDAERSSGIDKLIALYKSSLFIAGEDLHTEVPLAGVSITSVHPIVLEYAGTLFGRAVSSDYLLGCFTILAFSREELKMLDALNLPVEQIHPLSELDREERLWILKKKRSLPLSASQMRKLSSLITMTRAAGRLDFERWSRGIDSDKTSIKTGQELLSRLRAEILPGLKRREKEIADEIKKMRFPSSLKLSCPEDLEGDSFSCYFYFSSEEEFNRNLESLARAHESRKIKKILDLLNSCKEI